MRLIIATKNKGKLREIKGILHKADISLISLSELKRKFIIRENGKSFLENALKKAMAVSKVYKNNYVVGEDSGLKVDYLGGAPGIFSKRYSGGGSTYLKNNVKILKELENIPEKERKAHFFCCLVLVRDSQLIKTFEGKLTGFISEKIRGEGGFGYDPILYLPQYKKTVAELSWQDKNKISHRAKAFRKLKGYLAHFVL